MRDGTDEELMATLSSANVACGGHAGDDATMEASMFETLRLAHANGIALPEGFVGAQMQFLQTLPETMHSSMQNDLIAGNRLEAPWLCGAVARMAREAGLDAPVNRAVFAALKPYIDGSEVKAS